MSRLAHEYVCERPLAPDAWTCLDCARTGELSVRGVCLACGSAAVACVHVPGGGE